MQIESSKTGTNQARHLSCSQRSDTLRSNDEPNHYCTLYEKLLQVADDKINEACICTYLNMLI